MGIFRSGIGREGISVILGIYIQCESLGLRLYSSGLLRDLDLSSGWVSSSSVMWYSRFSGGIRVELYASGGAGFACCYTNYIYHKGR